ncbi:2',5'-phosphodiesterase 12 isoform X2 [Nilaparvata lugens]|uniref:2',5'-phosphodiesterase 12 isoform X2 n=1 Tax=Nilaparvata lugens TaxID=108931 RepID=UPI00193E823E|nr:2',5'-phosphodiesterase 12 isoform X2 [Nilaparvata lugens]
MDVKHFRFRVITYNILSDIYTETAEALSHLFHYCPRYALKMDYRKQLLIKEILGYNADLIFLQEVDEFFFNRDLKYVLGPAGYEGCFALKGSTVKEGVACFYSNDRFKLLHSESIILGEVIQNNHCLNEIWEVISKKEALKLRVIDRHTTLQILTLESLDKSDELLVVANTHLYFHPDADHVRLIQAGISIKYITDYIDKLKKETRRNVSLIFCGDFNSVPECGIYKLMTTGLVPDDYIDWKSNKEEAVEGLSLNQPWRMASACGTPQYTNFIQAFSGCLDYIFYQTDRLAVTQVVPFPTEEELRQHTALPSVVFPSDHIASIADLRWTS